MENNKFFQINPLGSADPNNKHISSLVGTLDPSHTDTWEKSPNNPIIQGFQNLFNDPSHQVIVDHPQAQIGLFDIDNIVKGDSGVFRQNQDGLTPFGSDIDGKPLYTFQNARDSTSYDLGKNRLYTGGDFFQRLGAFDNEADADKYAKFTSLSGNPEFMGRIEGLQAAGDTKGAVNHMLTSFDHPEVDSLHKSDDKDRGYGLAFAAYNYAQNAEKMSPSQKSLALSSMSTLAYKFGDGSAIGDKALIKHPDGSTAFSTGDAATLGKSGIDVFSLQKNWDQIDAVQRLTYGQGTASQMAATGQRMGFIGAVSGGPAAVQQSAAELGQAGFTAVPSAGIGAITGHQDALPSNYEVIGAGSAPGQIIAVPKGLSYSTSILNGSPEVRSLNNAAGLKPASTGAFKTYANQMPITKLADNTRGTSLSAGLGQSGALNDPYLKSSIITTSVMGNTVSRKLDGQQGQAAATGLRRQGEDVALNYVTGGISGKVQKVDAMTGGHLEGVREKVDKLNPINKATDKLGGKALSSASNLDISTSGISGGAFGGKGEAQKGRDSIRSIGVQSGLINKDNYTVSLSDGTTADVGVDAKGGQHEFRNPDQSQGVNRPLSSYDVDYTNDLDFTSNLMTNSLARMMSGGKGTSIDQVGGQLGNAALGKVGFGKDMTEENFNYVRDNVRGFYFKQGIQTKEDAYALSNQMFSEGRITEMDQVAMQQGINLVFDKDGFNQSQVVMSGRKKGMEVASDIHKSPGPNFDLFPTKPLTTSPKDTMLSPKGNELDPGSTLTTEEFSHIFNAGSYGGNSNTDVFTKSIIKYEDSINKNKKQLIAG